MKLKKFFSQAFALGADVCLTATDADILKRIAKFIVDKQMGEPALMFVQTLAPLNFIGASSLHFFEPFATMVLNKKDYNHFAELLENRRAVETLAKFIEEEMELREKDAAEEAEPAASGKDEKERNENET